MIRVARISRQHTSILLAIVLFVVHVVTLYYRIISLFIEDHLFQLLVLILEQLIFLHQLLILIRRVAHVLDHLFTNRLIQARLNRLYQTLVTLQALSLFLIVVIIGLGLLNLRVYRVFNRALNLTLNALRRATDRHLIQVGRDVFDVSGRKRALHVLEVDSGLEHAGGKSLVLFFKDG